MADRVASDLRSSRSVAGSMSPLTIRDRRRPCPLAGHLPTQGRTRAMSIRRGGDVTEDDLVAEGEVHGWGR